MNSYVYTWSWLPRHMGPSLPMPECLLTSVCPYIGEHCKSLECRLEELHRHGYLPLHFGPLSHAPITPRAVTLFHAPLPPSSGPRLNKAAATPVHSSASSRQSFLGQPGLGGNATVTCALRNSRVRLCHAPSVRVDTECRSQCSALSLAAVHQDIVGMGDAHIGYHAQCLTQLVTHLLNTPTKYTKHSIQITPMLFVALRTTCMLWTPRTYLQIFSLLLLCLRIWRSHSANDHM